MEIIRKQQGMISNYTKDIPVVQCMFNVNWLIQGLMTGKQWEEYNYTVIGLHSWVINSYIHLIYAGWASWDK